MTEHFSFYGETTFINRPINTVIRDFQNRYASGADDATRQVVNELSRLIEVVLQSKAMPDDQKEETVQAVHTVAEQVSTKRANKLTLKGTLEAIQSTVEKVADIAGPAVAIVASVLKLLGLAGV